MVHPSSPSGPNQPYGQGQPQHPQQQPYPQQGGYGYPQQPAPQGQPGYGQPHGGPGGPPPQFNGAPGAPTSLPGAAIAVRVLMFIGGPFGVLFGVLMGFAFLVAGDDIAMELQSAGLNSVFSVLGFVFALIPLAYGIASITLAAMMGRRKAGIYWGVIAFNLVAALLLVVLIFTGGFLMVLPLLFHGTMIGLMFVQQVRAYYTTA